MQSDRPPSPERDLRALYDGADVQIGSVEDEELVAEIEALAERVERLCWSM